MSFFSFHDSFFSSILFYVQTLLNRKKVFNEYSYYSSASGYR